jgi:uncharacterized protein YkwD
MKTFNKILLLTSLLFTMNMLYSQEIWQSSLQKLTSDYEKKILTKADLPQVYKDIPNDTLLQIERLTSYLFLKLINQYRQENGLNSLKWDENLWLAARNHNVYMAEESSFGHSENNINSPYFTGKQSINRANYIESNYIGVGENCCYPHINYLRFYIVNIVEESIESWKNSPGHNENMLNPDYYATGVSFYLDIKNHQVYGTNVFTKDKHIKTQILSLPWNPILETIYENYHGEKNAKYYNNELGIGRKNRQW